MHTIELVRNTTAEELYSTIANLDTLATLDNEVAFSFPGSRQVNLNPNVVTNVPRIVELPNKELPDLQYTPVISFSDLSLVADHHRIDTSSVVKLWHNFENNLNQTPPLPAELGRYVVQRTSRNPNRDRRQELIALQPPALLQLAAIALKQLGAADPDAAIVLVLAHCETQYEKQPSELLTWKNNLQIADTSDSFRCLKDLAPMRLSSFKQKGIEGVRGLIAIINNRPKTPTLSAATTAYVRQAIPAALPQVIEEVQSRIYNPYRTAAIDYEQQHAS